MRVETSKRFERAFKKFLDYDSKVKTKKVIEKLEINPFDPSLKTHKLKGRLTGLWACKVTDDLRILFEITEDEDGICILLNSVGTHDEVY
jgi:addiction module RelE/StbE family toxin